MPRNLSVRLGDVCTVPVAHHPLYSAIEAELRSGSVSVSRATPWMAPALGAAFGAALLLPAAASAATLVVDSGDWVVATDGFCTLPEAVQAASTNTPVEDCAAGDAGLDEIRFDGSLLGSTINVGNASNIPAGEPLNIVGPGTADQLVLDGGNNNRLLTADADVSISNLTAQNFYTADNGGAIYSTATVSVSNSQFTNNVAKYNGGAISTTGSVSVTGSQFSNNRSSYSYGGAVYAPSVTALDSQFDANYAYSAGGAIAALSADITNATFSNNYAYRFGGAINAFQQATVSGSTFTGNISYGLGGAIATSNADISGNSTFSYNEASGSGGAVFTYYGGAISNSSFADNRSGSGGAVFAGSLYSSGSPELTRWRSAGSRQKQGTHPGLNLSVIGSQFNRNEANSNFQSAVGGAIAALPFPAYSNSISISGSTLTDNRALRGGGGQPPQATAASSDRKLAPGPIVYGIGGGLMAGLPTSSIPTVTVTGKRAGKVAPPAVDVTVDIDDTTFTNNVAFLGGGASVFASTITVDDSTFDGNGAYVGGGGMFLPTKYGDPSGSSASFGTTSFDGNLAPAFAGVLAFSDTVSGNALSLVNNHTSLHPDLLPSPPPPLAGKRMARASNAKGTPLACGGSGSGGKYGIGGGGMLSGMSSVSLSGGSQINDNCAAYAAGGVVLAGGKYSGTDGTVTVAADSVVSNNQAYITAPGMVVSVGPSSKYGGSGGGASGSSASISGSFIGNTASLNAYGTGGGLTFGLKYGASATVSQASISGNQAAQGGGISIAAYSGPSATVTLTSNLVISDSTISGNSAVAGGGVNMAGAVASSGTAGLGNSRLRLSGITDKLQRMGVDTQRLERLETITERRHGMAAKAAKGAAQPLAAVLQNVTIDSNTTSPGGGSATIGEQGGGLLADNVALTMDHVTITGNSTGGQGGGIQLTGATLTTVDNSVIALNSDGGTAPDLGGSADVNFSLVQDITGATLNGANNLTGVDPMLDPLADNGGPTLTRLPQFGSPVVDAGDPAFNTGPLPNDQRGSGFPRDAGGATDMGAVEGITPVNLVSLAIAPSLFPEGAAATMTATLDATTPIDVMATVDFSGTAVFGTDFTAGDDDPMTAGTQILIPAGSLSGDIPINALTDASIEGDEPFHADVSAVSNANESGIVAADATITDVLPPPTASLVLSPPSNPEGGGNFTVTVNLSNAYGQPIVITLNFSGSATFGVDYTVEDQDPGAPGIQIVIPAGMTSGSVLITPLTDGENEPDEDLIVQIGSVSAGSATGSPGNGTITNVAAAPGGPAAIQAPDLIPTLNEWMLMLLGLLLPATVMVKLRRDRKGGKLEA